MNSGTIYLVPTLLGDETPLSLVLPDGTMKIVQESNYFLVENEKSARRFIKKVAPEKPQSELILKILDKDTQSTEYQHYIKPILAGENAIILSEAGAPGMADPGGNFILFAHQKDLKIVPMVGPSSILLAMMASGLNGQNFTFHGYLPIDKTERKKKIKYLEKISKENQQAQLFIETPYRNNALLETILESCLPNTFLCIAANITTDSEKISTQAIKNWKQKKIDLHKIPTLFILQSN